MTMTLLDKLSPKARRLLVLPLAALAPLALSPAPLLLSASGAHAAQFKMSQMMVLSNGRDTGFGGGASYSFGGPLPDTCNESGPSNVCEIDDFEQRCDDNGGGLSSEPGGGVDCDTSGWD
jgi:hypothetical protein